MASCESQTYKIYILLNDFRKYLSDPTEDVRVATENLLAAFLHEIREVTIVQKRYEEQMKARREAALLEQTRRGDADLEKEKSSDVSTTHPERASFVPEGEDADSENALEVLEESSCMSSVSIRRVYAFCREVV